jgi:site-specific recombinase XerD
MVPATCRKAGLKHVTMHGLGHTLASHLVMRGVSLMAVGGAEGEREATQ